MPRIVVDNLGGSLNQGRAPSDLDPNEYARLRNFHQQGGKLYRRGGMHRLTASPWEQRITGLVASGPAAVGGPFALTGMVVGGPTHLGLLVGDTIATIPTAPGLTIDYSLARWSLFQYKHVVYGIRPDAGLVRTDGLTVNTTGIAAPTVAPTLADGAAGDIPAASFQGVYTYYNSITGLESNPSPPSNILAHADGLQIGWSGISISLNPQVTNRRLYRTLPNQTGEYFLVADLANNVATIYSDNVLAQDLGDAASFVNGLPPANLRMGAVWKERLFASNGIDLYHSEDGMVEAFDPDAFIPISPDDRHEIRAIHPWGDRLVIGKTNGLYYLVGSDPNTFALPPVPNLSGHGCISHHTMQSAGGFLFWLDSDNVYRSDGNTVVGIADVKLRDVVADMDENAIQDAVAAVFPEFGWYVLSIPGYAQFVYNYKTDAWAEMPTLEDIQAIGIAISPDYLETLVVADDVGHAYRFHDIDYGHDDTSAALGGDITAEFDTKAFGTIPATKHVVEHVALLCPQYSEMVTLAIMSEGVVVKSREVSLDWEPRWKLYNLSTRHQAKAMSQLRFTYTGEERIELEGFALDISPLDRPTMQAR